MRLPDALQLALKVAGPDVDRAAVHYALAVSTLETDNGNWPRVPAGQGSHNMGAVIRWSPEQPVFQSGDTDGAGKPITQNFRVYPDDESGYRDFWHQLMHPNVLAAASANSGMEAVAHQYANGYFEADPGVYGQRLAAVYERVLAETGEPRLLSFARVAMLKKKGSEPPFQLALSRRRPAPSGSSGPHSGSAGGAK